MDKFFLRDNFQGSKAKAILFALFLVFTIAVAVIAFLKILPVVNTHASPMALAASAYLAVVSNPVDVS